MFDCIGDEIIFDRRTVGRLTVDQRGLANEIRSYLQSWQSDGEIEEEKCIAYAQGYVAGQADAPNASDIARINALLAAVREAAAEIHKLCHFHERDTRIATISAARKLGQSTSAALARALNAYEARP